MGSTTGTGTKSVTTSGRYIDKDDLEDKFGTQNITLWSQLDNALTTADNARIGKAIAWAERYVEERFLKSRYAVPFVSMADNSMVIIEGWMAKLGGYWLWENRFPRDNTNENNKKADSVRTAKLDTNHEIDLYLSGMRTLQVQITTSPQPTAPTVIT